MSHIDRIKLHPSKALQRGVILTGDQLYARMIKERIN